MRWALMGSFEHSNRELLALSICRDMTVFVIHMWAIRGPWRSQGVPEGSLGGLRDVPVGPRGVPRRPRGVPGRPRGVPGRPMGVPGSQGRAQGIPGIPQYNSVILFRNIIP